MRFCTGWTVHLPWSGADADLLLNVHKTPSRVTTRKEGMAYYSLVDPCLLSGHAKRLYVLISKIPLPLLSGAGGRCGEIAAECRVRLQGTFKRPNFFAIVLFGFTFTPFLLAGKGSPPPPTQRKNCQNARVNCCVLMPHYAVTKNLHKKLLRCEIFLTQPVGMAPCTKDAENMFCYTLVMVSI